VVLTAITIITEILCVDATISYRAVYARGAEGVGDRCSGLSVGTRANERDCCGDESTTVYVVADGGSVPVVTMAAAVTAAAAAVVSVGGGWWWW